MSLVNDQGQPVQPELEPSNENVETKETDVVCGFSIVLTKDGRMNFTVHGDADQVRLLGLLKFAESQLTQDIRTYENADILKRLDLIGQIVSTLAQQQFGNLLKK